MPFTSVTIPSIDLQTRAANRVLSQFRNSPIFMQVLWCLVSQVQALSDAIVAVQQSFMPANAGGVQLDALGRIVGITRGLIAVGDWFTPDSQFFAQPDNINPVWEYGAPLSGTLTMDDFNYRNAIFAKVFRNFCQVASITDIQNFIMDLFGINSSVVLFGPGEATIILPHGTSANIVAFIQSAVTNNSCDYIPNIPLPPGAQITQVVVQT